MTYRHIDATAHLQAHDPILGALIDIVGPCTLKLRRDRFDTLVRSILSQQISTAAARTIRGRLEDRIGVPRPETLLALSVEELRECGVSPQKASYLRDLAEHVSSGRLPLNRLGRLSDDEVIERLIAVKGIGRWTGQMFLMFSLGRPDVLPHDDLGIRAAMRRLYDLPDMPKRDEMDEIAAPWRPHATLACWYLWRSLELKSPTKVDVTIARRKSPLRRPSRPERE
ncbi:MAG: DNA-3-methyladenine glycosylase [Planctomycetota bacterium]|nr:DNA-3-methyladenine glycosylase 2 family protein [Planctomycetaceae bacterium]MDQ3330244.1 DNA-3-methyladenine glycosylase [Planctomycetota bacterium]